MRQSSLVGKRVEGVCDGIETTWFLMRYNYRRREEAPITKYHMLKSWLLIVWIGTTSNFQILHEAWSERQCQKELEVWSIVLNNVINKNLECVQDLREGRSQYPARPGSQGLVK